jgi:hypothetical protein
MQYGGQTDLAHLLFTDLCPLGILAPDNFRSVLDHSGSFTRRSGVGHDDRCVNEKGGSGQVFR